MPEKHSKTPDTPTIHSDGKKKAIKRVSLKINGADDNKAKKADAATSAKDQPATPFAYEDFLNVWDTMAAHYKDKSLSLHMALTQQKPRIEKEHTIRLSLENSIQQDLINENITDILSFLHRGLTNYQIRLETEIRQQESKQKAYLPKEKLEELIKKNPDIKKLKDELGLDLDY